MPYADPEIRKAKDREYKKLPEVQARSAENYRKRYEDNANGVRDKKRADHHTRWSDPEYQRKKKEEASNRWASDWSGQKIVQLRSKAKKTGIDFDIDASDIPLPKKCPVFGTELDLTRTDRNNAPSVDRIDNRKGYIKGNVVVISTKANAMKREATLEDLRRLLEFYENLVEDLHDE